MKAPAFQLYAGDFLVGTATMTAEEVGGYIRLLCYQWTQGRIPDDDAVLARLTGCGGNAVASIRHKFGICDGGGLANRRLEQVRAERAEYCAKQAENAKNGWETRKKERVGNAVAMPTHMPEACSSVFSLQSSDNTKKGAASPVLPFSSEAFAEAWALFRKHRTEIRKPLKPTAEAMALKWCAGIGERRALAAIELTVRKGWQGLREPDASDPAQSAPSAKPAPPPEPEYWREMINDEFPGSAYARGGMNEGTPWQSLDTATRSLVLANLPRWLGRTGRKR